MTDFRMPSLGADMDEGTLVEWLKQPGDPLKRGDIIAVVETQKGAIEIEVFHDGVLEATHVKLGAKVPVGELLATILTAGEEGVVKVAPTEVAPPASAPAPVIAVSAPPAPGLKITPAARRRAEELGLDLQSLAPGPDGVIGLSQIDAPVRPARGINLDEMRKAIAAAMARSKREIPHYYVGSVIDMTPLLDWLAAENAARAVPDRLLPATAVIKACALCLRQCPELNGHAADIKMGIAIAMRGGGLIAPALMSPDTLSLGEIMERLRDLTARVRGGRLRSSELTGATITLSSLGDDSADMVLPIIYPPQVAIIGVGQTVERPHVVAGAVALRKVATFTMAGDHRANDGRSAARFLNRLTQVLQKPEAL